MFYGRRFNPPSVARLFGDLFELVLADTANGANPIFGNLLKGGSGGDTSVGIADCRSRKPSRRLHNDTFHLFSCFNGE